MLDVVQAVAHAVGADRECGGLDIARAARIPTFVEPFSAPREAWSDRIADRIAAFEPDVVVLSGFMRLLSARAVARFEPAILNTHPAYLPEFPGAHGVRDAIAARADARPTWIAPDLRALLADEQELEPAMTALREEWSARDAVSEGEDVGRAVPQVLERLTP